jgi:tetratricopeptide (TPR) repeat protein
MASPLELLDQTQELIDQFDYEDALTTAQTALIQVRQTSSWPEESEEAALEAEDLMFRCQYAVLISANLAEQWDIAEVAGREALALSASHPLVEDSLATTLVRLGKWNEALTYLLRVEERERLIPELDNSQPQEFQDLAHELNRRDSLFSRLGQAYLGLAKEGQDQYITLSVEKFCAARNANQFSDDARAGLNELLTLIKGLPVEVQLRVERELQEKEHTADFLSRLMTSRLGDEGHALFDSDRFEEAIQIFEEMRTIFPDSKRAWAMSALCYQQLDRDEEVALAFEEVLRIEPGDPLAARYFALQKVRNGDVVQGTKELEELVERVPNRANIRAALGEAYLKACDQGEDRLEDATAEFRKAVELEPGQTSHAFMLGRCYTFAGQFEEANRIATALVISDPELGYNLVKTIRDHGGETSSSGASPSLITATSPDIDALNLLSEQFEEHVDNEERSATTKTILLMTEDDLIIMSDRVLRLFEREIEKSKQ